MLSSLLNDPLLDLAFYLVSQFTLSAAGYISSMTLAYFSNTTLRFSFNVGPRNKNRN